MLEQGMKIDTSLTNNCIVLDVDGNDAILFTGIQFVYAHGIEFNQKSKVYDWKYGDYSFDFKGMAEIKSKMIDEKQRETFKNMFEDNSVTLLKEYYPDIMKKIQKNEINSVNEIVKLCISNAEADHAITVRYDDLEKRLFNGVKNNDFSLNDLIEECIGNGIDNIGDLEVELTKQNLKSMLTDKFEKIKNEYPNFNQANIAKVSVKEILEENNIDMDKLNSKLNKGFEIPKKRKKMIKEMKDRKVRTICPNLLNNKKKI
ncbi:MULTISPECIES: hypothetical protein [unclassified Fusobacterium]|uniref:hypothetical protein n=1 Tax=unclassified Fusobacterium TaxID=2648384 RepID=UPI001B8B845B|nr:MULTISPECIES: hypothetical protein [unclassified Fusobacterium]MBR8701052.1 hypothetical protein [Fusobacterium sp. DD45]MBR8710824.1 hypothetical protein [Fusobacterium sp. DD28]MBR8751398.1 hypothetical protein [Fusobacterium sp. DD26]